MWPQGRFMDDRIFKNLPLTKFNFYKFGKLNCLYKSHPTEFRSFKTKNINVVLPSSPSKVEANRSRILELWSYIQTNKYQNRNYFFIQLDKQFYIGFCLHKGLPTRVKLKEPFFQHFFTLQMTRWYPLILPTGNWPK